MSIRFRLAALSLLALPFALPTVASAQISDSMIPLKTIISELNTFRTEYAEYYNKKDASALAAMYAPDAIVTNAKGETYIGEAAILAAITKEAPTYPHLVITSDTVIAFGRTAIDVGTLKMHPKEGGELVAKYQVVLRRGYKDWKLVRVSAVPVP